MYARAPNGDSPIFQSRIIELKLDNKRGERLEMTQEKGQKKCINPAKLLKRDCILAVRGVGNIAAALAMGGVTTDMSHKRGRWCVAAWVGQPFGK